MCHAVHGHAQPNILTPVQPAIVSSCWTYTPINLLRQHHSSTSSQATRFGLSNVMTRDTTRPTDGGPGHSLGDTDLLAGLWEEAPFARLPLDAPSELRELLDDIDNPKRVYAVVSASRRHNFQLLVQRCVRQSCLAVPRKLTCSHLDISFNFGMGAMLTSAQPLPALPAGSASRAGPLSADTTPRALEPWPPTSRAWITRRMDSVHG